MASYVTYTPTSGIAKAMFNFDAFGMSNYKLSGNVRVSISDSFSYADYLSPSYSLFYRGLYTDGSNEVTWTAEMIANVQDVLAIYSNFASIDFDWVGNYDSTPPGADSTPNPEDVGRLGTSDINISWIYRFDNGFAGISGANTDALLDYTGGAGDIFLNQYASKFAGDYSLDENTRARQTFLHELGHSLGLSHPHTSYNNGVATLTTDYSATASLGFNELGFRVDGAADMYKEYFTIMSYDDQLSYLPNFGVLFHAHTPMILDVIALQQAYGEGTGTHGTGNDTIISGTAGYRTYFDKGGTDTIVMSDYIDGSYLNMGVSIVGATHLVGVGMSLYDASNTIIFAGDPAHLRWFYGEYENAVGGVNVDVIVGNVLSNSIKGLGGNDFLSAEAGDDDLDGGSGNDEMEGGAGNDRFDWDASERLGADTMYGGIGDDTYVISGNDQVIEYSSEGVDKIWAAQTYSLSNLPFVENLELFGSDAINATGNGFSNSIIGNANNNILDGGGGADTLAGGDGNDWIEGGEGNDQFDWEGQAGNDTFLGGVGDDVYVISGLDQVIEGAGEGSDTIYSTVTLSLALIPNVENLTLFGTASASATGNSLNNTIRGNDENNVLDGGAGSDALIGGGGDDIYVRDVSGDVVTEALNGGSDSVYSAVSYTLGTNVENLFLAGVGTINGVGNGSDNTITGNGGNNRLNGKGGADTIIGLDGDDKLSWASADIYDGGAGIDALLVSARLNLTSVFNTRIQNIEQIDMTGASKNKLTLNRSDLLDLSSTTNTITVLGNAGDSINIVGKFSLHNATSSFRTYKVGAGFLQVDSDITAVA